MGFFHGGKADPTVDAMAKGGLQFFDMLQAQQQIAFQGNQAALNAISAAWAPVLASGAVPFGFSPGLDSLLKANVIQTGTQGIVNSMAAQDLRAMQEGGGAAVLPTGASEQIRAEIEATGQQGIAKGLQAEKIAGYDQGLKTLEGATQAELGVANAWDPAARAGATTGAGGLALQAGEEDWKEKQSGGILSNISSIAKTAGDVVGAATGVGHFAGLMKGPSTVLSQPSATGGWATSG